jgi:hypothetical protein
MTLERIRAVGAALDIGIEIAVRWRGGELDRLVNARHSALHEAVARWFVRHPGWSLAPEASFPSTASAASSTFWPGRQTLGRCSWSS